MIIRLQPAQLFLFSLDLFNRFFSADWFCERKKRKYSLQRYLHEIRSYWCLISLHGESYMVTELIELFHICVRNGSHLLWELWESCWLAFIPHPHWISGNKPLPDQKRNKRGELCHALSSLVGFRRCRQTGCLLIRIYAFCLFIPINHSWVYVDDHESKTGVEL